MAQSPAKDQSARGRLPAARRDRRPALAALAVLLILLGALGSALVAFRSSDRTSVLIAADDIPIGKVITADDFTSTSVSTDSVHLVRFDRRKLLVGQRARVGVPSGSLLNPKMFTEETQVPDGAQLVGIVVNTNQRPSEVPSVGAVVRVYFVPGASTQSTSTFGKQPGDKVVAAARVVNVGIGKGTDSRNVTVLVDDSLAGQVASLASTGNLAVSILPLGTTPPVDLESVK